LQAQEVTLTHPGGNLLRLEIAFARMTPSAAGFAYSLLVSSDLYGDKAPVLVLDAPQNGRSWSADAAFDKKPDHFLPISVTTTGNTVRLDVDLDGQSDVLGPGSFTPSVDIQMIHPRITDYQFDDQDFNW
jgi:hypothetical protein